jgi:tetratricopeptide (TPR) repeat protein
MEIALGDAGKRGLLLCLAIVIFCTIAYQATMLWLAWDWGRSSQLNQQVRGARLEPGNAEAWDRIGEALAANFDNADSTQSVSFFERAVQVDAHSASDWMDLAQAYEINGELSQASHAYEQAQNDYPISADVLWKYGNFLLREGQTSQGLQEVHRALLTDPKLIPLAISRIWTFDPDVNVILHNVLPDKQEARFDALDFLAAKHEDAASLETWKQITAVAKTKPIDIRDAFPFLNELTSTDQAAKAERIWHEALAASGRPDTEPADGSLIWNGGFEEPIVNGGLGWRFDQVPGAYISTDSNIQHSGEKSLRVDFTGGVNLDFHHVHQITPVEPSTHYIFQCFMRTDSISTESGMRFEVVDLNDNEVSLMTPDLTGTNPWTPLRIDVTTGRDTHFLDIRLRRLPSRLFDNKLSGTVWVDDVSLRQQPATAATHP